MLAFLVAVPFHPRHRQLFTRSAHHFLRRTSNPLLNSTPRSVTPKQRSFTSTSLTMSGTEATPGPLADVTTHGSPSVVGTSPIYAQCMLRINDPAASRDFYGKMLGMKELTRFDFPKFKFSLFFYAYTDVTPPAQSTPQTERAEWLWARPEPTVELTWNWIADTFEESMQKLSENPSPEEVYVNGNADDQPKGFGYVEIAVSDVSAAISSFDSGSVIQTPKPVNDDPKLIDAVVQDPDGYHVRLVGNADSSDGDSKPIARLDPVFSSVMIRVQDPSKAVPFFSRLGFDIVASTDLTDERASEWYMGVTAKRGDGSWARSKLRACTVTLRHEWGTEATEEPIYTNGNVKPFRGFGHVGVIVDDIYEASKKMEELGYKIVRKPSPFADVGEIAFVAEPSSEYWVEVIKRSGEPPASPYEQPVL